MTDTVQHIGPKRPRGRPPAAPRTKLALWLRARGITVTRLTQELAKHARARNLPAPTPDEISNAAVCRTKPSAAIMLLVRDATGGDVDLEDWVGDLQTADLGDAKKPKKGIAK